MLLTLLPRELLEFYKGVLDILLVLGLFSLAWAILAWLFAGRKTVYRKDGF